MSLFEEFIIAADRWKDARNEYKRKSALFIVDFANSFREYLGAPEQYMDHAAGRALFYVQPVKATADENGVYSFSVVNAAHQWLVRNEGGQWVTGLQLAINEVSNSVNLIYFWYLLRFVIRNNSTCEMTVGFKNNSFSFAIDDDEKRNEVYDFMAGLVRDTFAMPPWETTYKAPIGFVPSKGN